MLRKTLDDYGFTDSARIIVEQIPSRAGQRGLHGPDCTSVVMLALWSLIRWERKVGLMALETIGVDLEVLARQLDRLLNRKDTEKKVVVNRDGVLIYVKARQPIRHEIDDLLKPLLDQAKRESRLMHHDYVGSEHLLLAIIRSADAELSSLLRQHLVTYETLKETVLELL